MDNSTAMKPRSRLKGDPYQAYEQLPAEVRRALQESLVDWCPLRAREWHLDLLRRDRLRPAQAAAALVQAIRTHDQAEIAAFAKTWPKGAEAYPHLAAGASLQRYAGSEGIPAVPTRPRSESRAETRAAAQPSATPIPPNPGPRAEARADAKASAAKAGAGVKGEPATGVVAAARTGSAARTGAKSGPVKPGAPKPSRLKARTNRSRPAKPRSKIKPRARTRGKHPAGRRARR